MTASVAHRILMIRPNFFAYNPETAQSNSFQQELAGIETEAIREMALEEFDNFVAVLRSEGVEVLVFEDEEDPLTPDAVFPNNWFSTHPKLKQIITYPMLAQQRRLERRTDILQYLQKDLNYTLEDSLVAFEAKDEYLEGTGSIVLDRLNKIAYAALSPRTNYSVLKAWAKITGYQLHSFQALGPSGEFIYHTNVMMCIGDDFAVIGLDTVLDADRNALIASLEQSGKRIILLSKKQVFESFAGNMLQLTNSKGERLLVMSSTAYRSISKAQFKSFQDLGLKLVFAPLSIIETIGGGSARCMMAEIF